MIGITNSSIIKYILIPIIIILGFVACSQEVKDPVTLVYDPEVVPLISTDSVEMLISDSGLIRYKKVAPVWEIFDKAKDPHWFYPKGIYVEQYDSLFHVIATIQADTAWNYTRRKVWQLRGNVKMKNIKGETYTSQELMWDENTQRVYSNKYVVIHQPDKMTMRAYGFEANQQMTYYKFKRAEKVEMYVSEESNVNEEKKE